MKHKTIAKTIDLPLPQFSIHKFRKFILPALLIPGYLGLIAGLLSDYFITDAIVWTALLLTPFIIWPNTKKTGSKKYLWWSVTFIVLTFLTGVKTFYFLAAGLAILFVLESAFGSISHLGLFQLGLISPTFKYFNHMLGFPVRMKLTEWTGDILQFAGYKVSVNGNVLMMNGTEFSVDPGCVGSFRIFSDSPQL